MYANLTLGIILPLLLLLIKNKELGLKISFIAITAFMALRYDWGNDYWPYYDTFSLIQSDSSTIFNIRQSIDLFRNGEFVWAVLMKLFSGLGFFAFIICLSIAEYAILYRFVKKYCPQKYYWIAVFVLIMTTDFFVTASYLMRQYLCIMLYLVVYELMSEKTVYRYWLWSIGILLICSFIHISSVILFFTLPLYYLKKNSSKPNISLALGIVAIALVWRYVGANFIGDIVPILLGENDSMSAYVLYMTGSEKIGFNTGLGIIYKYAFLLYLILVIQEIDEKKQAILLIYCLSYLIYPIAELAPVANRLNIYFSLFSIFSRKKCRKNLETR